MGSAYAERMARIALYGDACGAALSASALTAFHISVAQCFPCGIKRPTDLLSAGSAAITRVRAAGELGSVVADNASRFTPIRREFTATLALEPSTPSRHAGLSGSRSPTTFA